MWKQMKGELVESSTRAKEKGYKVQKGFSAMVQADARFFAILHYHRAYTLVKRLRYIGNSLDDIPVRFRQPDEDDFPDASGRSRKRGGRKSGQSGVAKRIKFPGNTSAPAIFSVYEEISEIEFELLDIAFRNPLLALSRSQYQVPVS